MDNQLDFINYERILFQYGGGAKTSMKSVLRQVGTTNDEATFYSLILNCVNHITLTKLPKADMTSDNFRDSQLSDFGVPGGVACRD